MEQAGHCQICKIPGQGRKDFICENCGGLDKIVLFCEGCGKGREITLKELKELAHLLKQNIPLEKGTTIKVSGCANCSRGKIVKTTIYNNIRHPNK